MKPGWRGLGIKLTSCFLLLGDPGAGGAAECPLERQRAQEVAARIRHEWPMVEYNDQTQRVEAVGQDLARHHDRAGGVQWRFHVMRDLSVNAFAIGDGLIYITEGTLNHFPRNQELAAIIAHEMGHQLAKHFCSRQERKKSGVLSWFKDEPPEGESTQRRQVGSLTQVIDIRKEIEADRLAVKLLRSANIDPISMLTVVRQLPSGQASGHLGDRRRVYELQRLLDELDQSDPRPMRSYSAQ